MTQTMVANAKPAAEAEPAGQMEMMAQLVLVREFETKCAELHKAGEHMVGEYHLSLGQEAIAVGTCAGVRQDDLICPSIRGMGIYLCRGTPLDFLTTTFFDRVGGIGAGRWAHWHSPDPEHGILAQTGMLGSGLVTSVGVAMSQKHLRTGKIVVTMLGDGATNVGYVHEGLNFAAFGELPVVFIIENNQYAVSTPISSVIKTENLSVRAQGYGMPGVTIDGNDVMLVKKTVSEAAERARSGGGPSLIECVTYRHSGSTVKDPDKLRPQAEKEAALRQCPVQRFKKLLIERGLLNEKDYESLVTKARKRIDEAVRVGKSRDPFKPSADPLKEYWPYAEGVSQ
jgi:acetoin:2,6-dichlorophenolindophenol oxidoreductase subunit alpha